MGEELKAWVADALHAVAGFSSSSVASYVASLPQSAPRRETSSRHSSKRPTSMIQIFVMNCGSGRAGPPVPKHPHNNLEGDGNPYHLRTRTTLRTE